MDTKHGAPATGERCQPLAFGPDDEGHGAGDIDTGPLTVRPAEGEQRHVGRRVEAQ